MDGMTYLDQISTLKGPQKQSGLAKLKGIFTPKVIKIIIGVVVGVVVLILGAVGVNYLNRDKGIEPAVQTYYRMTNLTNTIDSYSSKVKASGLRSITATLKATLTATGRDLSGVLTQMDLGDVSKITSDEAVHIAGVNAALNQAELSGRLDREYLNQMTLEVSLLISLADEVAERTKSANLQAVMGGLVGDLQNIKTQLDGYTSLAS